MLKSIGVVEQRGWLSYRMRLEPMIRVFINPVVEKTPKIMCQVLAEC